MERTRENFISRIKSVPLILSVLRAKRNIISYLAGSARDYGVKSIYPWQRADIIIGTLSLNIFALATPVAVQQLYDRIIPHKSLSTFSLIAIAIVIVTIFESIIRVARFHIISWIGVYYEYALTQGYFASIINSSLIGIISKGAGRHIENVENAAAIREFEVGQGFISLLDLPFVILFLGLMAYFAGALVLAPIITLLFFIWQAIRSGSNIRKSLEHRMDTDDRRYNYLIEILKNHQTIKGLGMEHLILRRYESIHSHSSTIEYELSLYNSEARDLGNMCAYIMFVSIVFIGAMQIMSGEITTGVMSACTFLSNRIMQPVQSAMGMWVRIQHYQVAKKRHKQMPQLKAEPNLNNGVNAKGLKGSIELKNVSFQYENGKELLKNISLNIDHGSFVTLVGNNGSGKTTLMLLLMGLFHAKSGEISIDMVPIKAFNLRSLREKMAYIPPNGTLFQGTIMDNLTMFRSHEKTMIEKAFHTTKDLGVYSWINKLPYGFATPIGDGLFSSMSAGIQQIICLARALLAQPKILILDEVNTSMDSQGDESIKKIIESIRGKTTIIFVTHRPSICKAADAIYTIENGLVQQTNYNDLLRYNSLFKEGST